MTWLKAILYMQSEIKKKRCWRIMLKKLKRGLRACRLKMGGGGLQAAISSKAKMYLSQNYKKKPPNFIVRFPSA